MSLLFALLIGVVAGLRAMTAPAAIAWAAYLGWIDLSHTFLSFMGSVWAVGVLTLFALVELVTDQLPTTPSRTVPPQFGARIVMGAIAGTALGFAAGGFGPGAVAGLVGAVIGTLGGAKARGALARKFGQDRPAALIEDAIALLGALLIVVAA
ncbi:DUF4126 domain-containing protein [Martelella alba]|uniref:DUF4126 domain-containing protein n=1 Tax=Martelella alba TaxID=2590451 RepID=A0A506U9E2_9HYPH|nr:DUF4126 family protein [Martelella alba]TPW30993.1 DUF4126 domain-containing protein [Martelella alba]